MAAAVCSPAISSRRLPDVVAIVGGGVSQQGKGDGYDRAITLHASHVSQPLPPPLFRASHRCCTAASSAIHCGPSKSVCATCSSRIATPSTPQLASAPQATPRKYHCRLIMVVVEWDWIGRWGDEILWVGRPAGGRDAKSIHTRPACPVLSEPNARTSCRGRPPAARRVPGPAAGSTGASAAQRAADPT